MDGKLLLDNWCWWLKDQAYLYCDGLFGYLQLNKKKIKEKCIDDNPMKTLELKYSGIYIFIFVQTYNVMFHL